MIIRTTYGFLRKTKLVWIFFLLILFVNTLFPFEISIKDALSWDTAEGYNVVISPWRLAFEPFFGPLLFLNRSFYALRELPLLLVWIFLAGLPVFFIKLYREKERRVTMIGKWLLYVPIIVGLWFTGFLLLNFVKLPSNTIENGTEKVLITTHSHTEYSHDGLISPEGLWEWHQRNSFDAFFITDHNIHTPALDFVKAQRKGVFPSHPLVICGEEFSGSNHLSLLGLKREFKTDGYTDKQACDSVREVNGALIVNHWFDGKHKSLEYYRDLGVDGFEIENTATDRYYDRELYKEIKQFCTENGLLMVGGLDFHGYGNSCSVWNALNIPDWHAMSQQEQESSIIGVLNRGKQEDVQVLVYSDRPYYEKSGLFLRQPITIVNYFRGLRLPQLVSWLVWLLVFALFKSGKKHKGPDFAAYGLPAGLFMLYTGILYYFSNESTESFTGLYAEYSRILFIAASVLLIYSLVVLYFGKTKLKKRKN